MLFVNWTINYSINLSAQIELISFTFFALSLERTLSNLNILFLQKFGLGVYV